MTYYLKNISLFYLFIWQQTWPIRLEERHLSAFDHSCLRYIAPQPPSFSRISSAVISSARALDRRCCDARAQMHDLRAYLISHLFCFSVLLLVIFGEPLCWDWIVAVIFWFFSCLWKQVHKSVDFWWIIGELSLIESPLLMRHLSHVC